MGQFHGTTAGRIRLVTFPLPPTCHPPPGQTETPRYPGGCRCHLDSGGLVSHVTSQFPADPSPPGTPSEAETQRRMAFQAGHTEVGFAFRDGQWIAYWADADCVPQYRTAGTLAGLLDLVEPLFP